MENPTRNGLKTSEFVVVMLYFFVVLFGAKLGFNPTPEDFDNLQMAVIAYIGGRSSVKLLPALLSVLGAKVSTTTPTPGDRREPTS